MLRQPRIDRDTLSSIAYDDPDTYDDTPRYLWGPGFKFEDLSDEINSHNNSLFATLREAIEELLGYDSPEADENAKALIPDVYNACSPDGPHKTYGQFVGRIVYSSKGRIELRLKSVRKLDSLPCPPPIVPLHPMIQ